MDAPLFRSLTGYDECVAIQVGDTVVDRDGQLAGEVRGASERCTLTSCSGVRVFVRWPDGRATKPCSKGLEQIGTGVYRII
jgi:hypothetical protein